MAIEQTFPGIARQTVLLGTPRDLSFIKEGTSIFEIGQAGKYPRGGHLGGGDQKELHGTGTLVSLAGGRVKGVLTAGHVLNSIEEQQAIRKLKGGPYLRVSGGQDRVLEARQTWEHTLIIRQPTWVKSWGTDAGLEVEKGGEGWKPDIGFVWIPEAHAEVMKQEWGMTFYPIEGKEGRVKEYRKHGMEMLRLAVGIIGERQGADKGSERALLALASWPDNAAGHETVEGHEVWIYSLKGGEDQELVEMTRVKSGGAWSKTQPVEIGTYGGMSGGGVWSIYFRADQAPRSMYSELHGVTFAESPGGEGKPKELLWSIGEGTMEKFLARMAEEVQRLGEEPSGTS